MKALLALLLSSALCFAEPVVHAEPAKSGSPVGGAGERSEPEGVPSAESAESGSPAGGAGERSEPEGVPRAETAVSAEPAAVGGASSPSEPNPARRGRRAQRPPLRAEVSLVDGSILKGALRQHAIPACSPALGRVRIDLAKVERIDFIPPDSPAGSSAGGARSGRREGAGGAAEPGRGATSQSRIAFRNGDRLTVRFPDDLRFLPFDTLLGRVRLPLRAVSSISFNSSTPSTASTLLYHCTFESPESISHPAAGPAGTFLGGEFVPGKVGKALLVKARTPAAEVPFPTGLMQPEGCIEFWAKIPGATRETRYPDGGNPMFFAMGVGRWVNTFVKYTANDGFGTGGLHADLPGSAYVSSLPSWGGSAAYPDFLGDPAAWHHYALVWSEKGLDAASEALGRRVVSALYVDGCLVNPAYGTNGPDRARFLREFVVNPVVLGFPFLRERQDPKQGQVDYLIDEFKIWSVPKTDFSVSTTEPPNHRTTQPPKLLYHCTFDSAEAIVRPATGPNGKFLGGEFVPGKVGNALRTFADEPAAEADFEPGILGQRGTIEFWAKKETTDDVAFAESGNLRFFGLWLFAKGETPPWCSTHLQFTSNDGMGMSGLCGMINHCSWATKPSFGGWPYDVIRDSLFDWHHYAVVWDAEGLPGTKAPDGGLAVVQVYLDGQPVPTQGRQTISFGGKHLRNIAAQYGKLAFPTPSNGWNPSKSHIPYMIDEFKIWSAPKTDFGNR